MTRRIIRGQRRRAIRGTIDHNQQLHPVLIKSDKIGQINIQHARQPRFLIMGRDDNGQLHRLEISCYPVFSES